MCSAHTAVRRTRHLMRSLHMPEVTEPSVVNETAEQSTHGLIIQGNWPPAAETARYIRFDEQNKGTAQPDAVHKP